MKLKIAKGAAALALAAAAALAFPVAASAAGNYPPGGVETPGPGVRVGLTTPAGIFAGNESVTVLHSGEDANFSSLGVVHAVYVSSANLGSITSASDGSTSFAITLPDTATGTYTTVLTSASRPQGYSITFAADGTVLSGGASGGTGSTGGGLPATGMDSGSLLGLWAGGGALVLAGGAVAVGAAVHRQRKNADA